MTTATTIEIAPATAKAILIKAGLKYGYVKRDDYYGCGFKFYNNTFTWTSRSYDAKHQFGYTLKLIAYLNANSIGYEIVGAEGHQATIGGDIRLTNGGK